LAALDESMKKKRPITQKRLKELMNYNPSTGVFLRKKRRLWIGHRAGGKVRGGYIRIGVGGRSYQAHHLAWLYVYGKLPTMIDHKNGDAGDNRISNLRIATGAQNAYNKRRKDGHKRLKGTRFVFNSKKWVASIGKDCQSYYLGTFDTEEAAHAAYCAASKKLHGEFGCTS
jgi:hypothetical protein